MKRTKALYSFIYLFCVLFVSCGLETYVYLEPVESVITTGDTSAFITLPPVPPQHSLFRNYMIYYRIYLTDDPNRFTFINERVSVPPTGIGTGHLGAIIVLPALLALLTLGWLGLILYRRRKVPGYDR